MIVVDKAACRLYELFYAWPQDERIVGSIFGRRLRPSLELAPARWLDLGRRGRTPHLSRDS